MQPSSRSLLISIRSALSAAITPSLTTQSARWDLYEAYVLGIVLRAARKEGATVSYETVSGARPTVFTFRTNPGVIQSTRRQYTHAIIEFPGKPALEAHIGIRVAGKTGVPHECDVMVILRSEAQRCRNSTSFPRSAKILIAVECKFYATRTNLLGQARAFLGLASELSSKHSYFISNEYYDIADKLLAKRKQSYAMGIIPGANARNEVERLRNHFQSAFASFKAQNI